MRMPQLFAALICLAAMAPMSGMAQQVPGCVSGELGDPPRIVYQCANGLVLEAEAAAALNFQAAGSQARPETVELMKNGVLIEVEPNSGPLQILTPHAIAAVRGTIYAVDVTDTMTAVFVTRGEVAVSRPDGSEQVVLPAGYGVEVSAGQPLVVKLWPQEKVARLLARFGR